MIRIIKSITGREVFEKNPEVKKRLWWGEFRTDWYYANTVWIFAWEQTIRAYIQNQWKKLKYDRIHQRREVRQKGLFDFG
jgi:putative transposase